MADVLGSLLARNLEVKGFDYITYVPTDHSRIRQRGFDHAKRIAQAAAVELEMPLVSALGRTRSSQQLGRGRLDRLEEVKDVFYAKNSRLAEGKHALLVDDVLSTGATLESAATTLKQAGTHRVSVAILAHNR